MSRARMLSCRAMVAAGVLVCLCIGVVGPTPGHAAVYDRFIVFGDSLSDTGNVYLATGGALPTSPPYFNGRMSNGPLWVEHLATAEGIAVPTPALAGGTNFAFAGAGTGEGLSSVGSPNLQSQVGLYLTSGLTPAADDLFIIWTAANDFVIEGEDMPAEVVARLMTSVQTLAAAGARNFLIGNLPDLTAIPNADQPPTQFVLTPGNLGVRTAGYNSLLDAALDDLRAAAPQLNLIEFDAADLLDRVLANPAAFGFTNTTDPAFDPMTGIVPNPDQYLWWDTVHISARTHQIVAQEVALLIPEPTTATLLLLGAGLLIRRPSRR